MVKMVKIVKMNDNLKQQLNEASKDGDLENVKTLIKNGLALSMAAEDGHLDVVKYLVSKGADVHVRHEGVLRNAARYGYLEIVKYLVEECGANIHALDDEAFNQTVWWGRHEIGKYLKTYDVLQFIKKHINKQIVASYV